ncbi:MAG: hypothetical protein C0631_12620 [Sedimenticola sp.]|nr:MAG: hypothetical protein C0631_12620 [Sedimenticola sp.]
MEQMQKISQENQIDSRHSSIDTGLGLLDPPVMPGKHLRSRINLYAAIAGILWSLVVGLTAYLNIHQHRGGALEMARQVAEAYFRKDQAFRFWGAKHGGVYVPVTEETPPNEYLTNIPEREILTPSGRRLTLMNPAYMMRQINEDFAELYGSAAHLTSLMPLDPDNTPDPWERKALLMFEKGAEVVTEVVGEGEDQTLRLMRPMMVSRPCLKCHESQGYREGDVRGGLSVSLPLSQFQTHTAEHELTMVLSYGLFWLLGMGVITLIARRGSRVANEREQSQAKLIGAHNYTREVISSLGEGLYGVDHEGKLVFLNPAGERILGWKEEELVGRSVHNAIHHTHEDGDLYPKEECPLLQVLGTGMAYASDEDYFVRKDGSLFPVSYISTPIYDGNRVSGAVMAFEDITERRGDEARIRHLAHHDPLTSLPNRALLLELLAHGVAQAKRYGHSIAVLFVDLDDFILINDTLGHSLGDELLLQVSGRLRELIREPDILARQGGDEFIVMICNQPSLHGAAGGDETMTFTEHALTICERLLQAFERPFTLQDSELTLSAYSGPS